MAKHLDDGHVTLMADALGRNENAEVTVYPHYPDVDGLENLIDAKYLDDGFTTAAQDEISWGTIGNLGYISTTSMEELSASGDEDDDIAAASAAMS
ncbi:MAG: hypothetical protein E6J91_22245 [Deltaproteobacteria bacterium]|nr:MAG: hypothetical protein E6J91_22245 [Deltaproteobacteria bacterium]